MQEATVWNEDGGLLSGEFDRETRVWDCDGVELEFDEDREIGNSTFWNCHDQFSSAYEQLLYNVAMISRREV